jgi:hypothetical protein
VRARSLDRGSRPIWRLLWIRLARISLRRNLWSIRRHLREVGELNRGQFDRSPSYEAVILALFLALVGVATALYLTLAPN